MTVNPIPEGFRALTPYLTVKGGEAALDFYRRAFGAEVLSKMPGPDGRLMHAQLRIGDSMLMLSDEFPEFGGNPSPLSHSGTVFGGIQLYVSDVDAVWRRALEAGAKEKLPLANQFWGDRYGKLIDPFGHEWALATRLEELSDEETIRRMKQMGGT